MEVEDGRYGRQKEMGRRHRRREGGREGGKRSVTRSRINGRPILAPFPSSPFPLKPPFFSSPFFSVKSPPSNTLVSLLLRRRRPLPTPPFGNRHLFFLDSPMPLHRLESGLRRRPLPTLFSLLPRRLLLFRSPLLGEFFLFSVTRWGGGEERQHVCVEDASEKGGEDGGWKKRRRKGKRGAPLQGGRGSGEESCLLSRHAILIPLLHLRTVQCTVHEGKKKEARARGAE